MSVLKELGKRNKIMVLPVSEAKGISITDKQFNLERLIYKFWTQTPVK